MGAHQTRYRSGARHGYAQRYHRQRMVRPGLHAREDLRSPARARGQRPGTAARVPVLRHTATPGREGRQGAHVGGVGPLCGMGRRQGRLGPHQ